MPLLNPKEEAFAVFFVGNPTSELKAASNTLIRNAILISVIVLIAAMGILFWIISSISTPLTTLASKMDEIGEGHLLTTIGVKGNDEIGHVGTALRKISHTLHKLIDDITGAISEHAKGNIEYHLDTNVFQGDYRLLANRIIELSNVSTKDQLTGLPNRRSFDGRLDVEWTRAMRDQTPLSFLIIDVDRFKTYNDTYGHQQGDVVLKTVAKIMTVPLKRLIDFAARWGGEEFVVLLPNTDSRGAMIVAERIRTQVEAAEIPCHDDGAGKKVTVSIGVCTQIPPAKCCVEKLVSQADAALYRAKETGRNRVCRHED